MNPAPKTDPIDLAATLAEDHSHLIRVKGRGLRGLLQSLEQAQWRKKRRVSDGLWLVTLQRIGS